MSLLLNAASGLANHEALASSFHNGLGHFFRRVDFENALHLRELEQPEVAARDPDYRRDGLRVLRVLCSSPATLRGFGFINDNQNSRIRQGISPAIARFRCSQNALSISKADPITTRVSLGIAQLSALGEERLRQEVRDRKHCTRTCRCGRGGSRPYRVGGTAA